MFDLILHIYYVTVSDIEMPLIVLRGIQLYGISFTLNPINYLQYCNVKVVINKEGGDQNINEFAVNKQQRRN